MTREVFAKALKEIEKEVLSLTEMVKEAIKEAVYALKERDLEKSKKIVHNDLLINQKRFEIEEKSLALIATQQPTAGDLRIIFAILSIITDLERMGDHAEGIAKISLMIGDRPLVKPLVDIPRMAEKAVNMLEKCIKAFVERDVETARNLGNEDDEIDNLNEQVYNELILKMIENPGIIKDATYLIWTSHNLERIADRVTNIAERIVFMVTGKMEEINVSKY